MDTKTRPIYSVYKKPTSDLKTRRLKVRGWKNILHANGKQKKTGVAILISDKIDLKINVKRTYIVKKYKRRKNIYKINPQNLRK